MAALSPLRLAEAEADAAMRSGVKVRMQIEAQRQADERALKRGTI